MANKRSALKAHRISERKRLRNRSVRSALHTYVRKAREGIAGTEADAATSAVALAVKQLDSAASKGTIHRNQAARRKSRLMHQLAVRIAGGMAAAEGTTTTRRRTVRTPGTTRKRK